MKRINNNIYPKDGHWYREKDGAKIRADSWAGVIVRLIAYRKRAGYAPGSPAEEVIAQACSRNPIICTDDNGQQESLVKRATLKSRILSWMALARKHKAEQKIEYVDAKTAADRAQICAGCRFNASLSEGCASCRQALSEMRNEVLGRRTIDNRLQGCLVLGEDLPTAAHLERETVDNAELPDNCWRKRTL